VLVLLLVGVFFFVRRRRAKDKKEEVGVKGEEEARPAEMLKPEMDGSSAVPKPGVELEDNKREIGAELEGGKATGAELDGQEGKRVVEMEASQQEIYEMDAGEVAAEMGVEENQSGVSPMSRNATLVGSPRSGVVSPSSPRGGGNLGSAVSPRTSAFGEGRMSVDELFFTR